MEKAENPLPKASGKMILPGGGTILPAGKTVFPDGGTVLSDGKMDLPDSETILTAGRTILPDGKMDMPGGGTVLPDSRMGLAGIKMAGSACRRQTARVAPKARPDFGIVDRIYGRKPAECVAKVASRNLRAVWKKRRPGHKPPLVINLTFLAPAGGRLLRGRNGYGDWLGD